MTTKRNLARALATALAIASIGTAAWAAPPPKECGLIGTWAGAIGGSAAWLGVQTAGSTDDKNGEMVLNFVYVAPYLLPSSATHFAPGHGVWQQTQKGHYTYTWYTYGMNDINSPVFTVRVRGVATSIDCNNTQISYTYEVFPPAYPPQSVTGPLLYSVTDDDGYQTRILLVAP